MSGERSSRDILQSLLVLEDDRAFRLEQAENRYRKKVRTLKTAADAEIAGLKDERRGPAQHEREVRIGLQVLPMSDDDWDAMQHRHAIAKQNIEDIDDQLRQREEQRLRDLQRAKDKYAQRQLNICSLHNTEWTRFVEQLGQSIGVSSAQHRYISACLTMIQTSRERPILISPTPSPEPGLRLPRTREPDSSHSGGLTTLPTYRDYDRPSNMNSRHIVNGAGTGHRAGPSAAPVRRNGSRVNGVIWPGTIDPEDGHGSSTQSSGTHCNTRTPTPVGHSNLMGNGTGSEYGREGLGLSYRSVPGPLDIELREMSGRRSR
jgi:hypothetical protein